MPSHPAFAAHLHLLDGVPSFADRGGDPAAMQLFGEYYRATTFGRPPHCPDPHLGCRAVERRRSVIGIDLYKSMAILCE